MPCYLFTFHAYGSWMPDRKRGYTKRGKGYLPRDGEMNDNYRRNMSEDPARCDHQIQKLIVNEILVASGFQRFVARAIGTDDSHIHALVTWIDTRTWERLRNGIRSSITRCLNRQLKSRRKWLSESASRKRVNDRKHYDYLTDTYLPDHPGWKWSRRKGLYL